MGRRDALDSGDVSGAGQTEKFQNNFVLVFVEKVGNRLTAKLCFIGDQRVWDLYSKGRGIFSKMFLGVYVTVYGEKFFALVDQFIGATRHIKVGDIG